LHSDSSADGYFAYPDTAALSICGVAYLP